MIKVAIADDEALVAQSLATLLGLEDDIEVVRTASSGRELIDWCAVHPIDVAVLDLQMPGLDGIDTASQLSDAAVLIVPPTPAGAQAGPGRQRAGFRAQDILG